MSTTSASMPTARTLERSVPGGVTSHVDSVLRTLLLTCGILSSVMYVVADITGGMMYEGYSFASHTVSELSAIDAPSRPYAVPMFLAFSGLLVAFGIGVRRYSGDTRALRVAGALIIAYGIVCMTAPLVPMHTRDVIAAGGATLTDTLHIASTVLDVVLILAIIAFVASAFGTTFRAYSIATVIVMLVFGTLTALDAAALEANLPTPTAGLTERVNIYAFLLWFVVAAVALRSRSTSESSISFRGYRSRDPLD